MALRANQLAWNPMEAFIFTCASEDYRYEHLNCPHISKRFKNNSYSLYTFDSRNLKSALNIHMDHVSAVTCLDYSPTGREIVSGSYDKTIRIHELFKVCTHKNLMVLKPIYTI